MDTVFLKLLSLSAWACDGSPNHPETGSQMADLQPVGTGGHPASLSLYSGKCIQSDAPGTPSRGTDSGRNAPGSTAHSAAGI